MNRIAIALPVLALAARPLPSYADKQAAQQTAYIQTNLVFGLTGTGVIQDPNLLTPWGVTFAPAGPFIVADNGDGRATSYSDDPQPLTTPLIINIASQSASPTGDAFVSVPDEFEITGPNHAGVLSLSPRSSSSPRRGARSKAGIRPSIPPEGSTDRAAPRPRPSPRSTIPKRAPPIPASHLPAPRMATVSSPPISRKAASTSSTTSSGLSSCRPALSPIPICPAASCRSTS